MFGASTLCRLIACAVFVTVGRFQSIYAGYCIVQIIMTPDEVKILSSFLQETDHYYEFGMGGSTWLASGLVRESITSVESDKQWVENVKNELKDCSLELNLQHIDIGPTGGWGTPMNRSCEHLFPNYSRSILRANTDLIDFCLVDGRFRVACFLNALLCLRHDSIIAIHDYTVRPNYHLVEQFARKISAVNTLAFFVRKPDMDIRKISKLISQYETNYD